MPALDPRARFLRALIFSETRWLRALNCKGEVRYGFFLTRRPDPRGLAGGCARF